MVFGITSVLFLIFALIGHYTKMDLTKYDNNDDYNDNDLDIPPFIRDRQDF